MTPDSRRHFRFRAPWWAWLLALAGCAAGIALGQWQSGRAADKRAAAAEATRPIELRGELLAAKTLYLANRLHHGRTGFQVLQPLQSATGEAVLVLRGWIPAAPGAQAPPAVATPAGPLLLRGSRLDRLPRALEPPGAPHAGNVRQNITLDEFASWAGMALAPYVLQQRSGPEDGLQRDWPAPDAGAEKNDSYALQWYGLALLSLVLFVVLNVRREGPSRS